jgi:transcriptional regulator with XRE-family HTH domain
VSPSKPGLSLSNAFGLAVRNRRDGLELSQEELGFRAELDRTYISMVERGVRSPSLNTVAKLAKALRTQASTLVAAAERIAGNA